MKEFDGVPKDKLKKHCISFFYWWYNQPGTNTEEGFEKWFEQNQKLKKQPLKQVRDYESK